jgi:hypothetical protein
MSEEAYPIIAECEITSCHEPPRWVIISTRVHDGDDGKWAEDYELQVCAGHEHLGRRRYSLRSGEWFDVCPLRTRRDQSRYPGRVSVMTNPSERK